MNESEKEMTHKTDKHGNIAKEELDRYVVDTYDDYRASDLRWNIDYGAQTAIDAMEYTISKLGKLGYTPFSFKKFLINKAEEQLRDALIEPKTGSDLVPYYLSIIKYLKGVEK